MSEQVDAMRQLQAKVLEDSQKFVEDFNKRARSK